MKKRIIIPLAFIIVLGIGAFINHQTGNKNISDPRNAVYMADGLKARYFGNEAKGDLNNDDIPDTAFLITTDGGGSGTFYYVIAVLNTTEGYKPTNAILLGDRIAPQTTEIRDKKLIVNYADRKKTDPMTTAPSVGVSKYFTVSGQVLKADK
jgi:hypothetical protein